MINTTDRVIVLNEGRSLNSFIRQALSWTETLMGELQKDTIRKSYPQKVFGNFLGDENRNTKYFDADFIHAAFAFASSDALNTATRPNMAKMAEYVKKRTVAGPGYPLVKRGIKLALVELWRQGALMLPTIFTPGSYFPFEAFDHEILNWLRSFDPKSDNGTQKTDAARMYYFGPRLLFATNWSCIEDVSLKDIAELHHAQRLYSNGKYPYAIAASAFPFSQISAELLNQLPKRTSFSKEDLVRYSAWATQQAVGRGDFERFVFEQKTVKERARGAANGRGPTRPGHIQQSKGTKSDFENEAKGALTHEAVLAIFKRFSKRPPTTNWLKQIPTYPGREHINVAPLCEEWVKSFKAFLHYREQIQGYRNSNSVFSSLNILGDYLFFYLPWWSELFPENRLELPKAPKDFVRYVYVSRHSEESIENLPSTLLRMIRLRRSTPESVYIFIKHITIYFRFVETHFNHDEKIAGPTFRNPLDDKFDAPRLTVKKNKTNKEIIPRSIFGHMLFYFYAIETFGQFLLEQALNGKFVGALAEMRSSTQFECAKFGMTPTVRHRGHDYVVRYVPNVFTWSKREALQNGSKTTIWAPHLTALRLLIVSLETGLRCQSVQWLDRTTWDSLNNGAAERYTYKLFVNTDKSKTEPWETPIVFRAHDVMLREVEFQKFFVDFETFEPVFYEGIENSPFKPIRPLFKAPLGPGPIHDNYYYAAWLALQVGFESFYKTATGEQHVRLYYTRAVKTSDGQPVVRYTGREANAYCPISILAVHTPHACRATFCTNKQATGLLELSDVAELVGHEGEATTAHYTKFSGEQLQERLEHSDKVMVGDYSIFDIGSDSGYVRPDKPDSALVKGFLKDREVTLKNFRFMPSMALWTIEEEQMAKHDGLKLLQEGPMSRIRFRETHVCPVGEECPSDIIEHIGAPKRCGICPLAMKCIDHLPAIAAKQNQLVERIRYLHAQRKRIEAAGEPITTIDAIWDELQLEINELLGWKFSEEVLQEMLAQAQQHDEATSVFHVERPDVVRRHLQLVNRQCDKTEFLLHRLAESNAFPSMSSPQVQMAAATLRRQFSAGQHLDTLVSPDGELDDVRSVASMLGTMMKANGLSMKEVTRLMREPTHTPLAGPVLLTREANDGK